MHLSTQSFHSKNVSFLVPMGICDSDTLNYIMQCMIQVVNTIIDDKYTITGFSSKKDSISIFESYDIVY